MTEHCSNSLTKDLIHVQRVYFKHTVLYNSSEVLGKNIMVISTLMHSLYWPPKIHDGVDAMILSAITSFDSSCR